MAPDPIELKPVRTILYVDDSASWHQSARLLAQYVRQAGGSVTVVSTAILPSTRRRALEEAKRVLSLPEDQVKIVSRPGLAEAVIPALSREENADVVVIGRMGNVDRLSSGLIGSLVVRRTPAPVLVIRGRPHSIRGILVCTEGARHGLANFELAARLAKAYGARLTILHVLSQMRLTGESDFPTQESLDGFLASDDPVAEHLRDLEARVKASGIEGEVAVRTGLVVDEILDALREGGHDLLVIGAHQVRGRDESILYEDIAAHIVRASPVSTLVVRDKAPR